MGGADVEQLIRPDHLGHAHNDGERHAGRGAKVALEHGLIFFSQRQCHINLQHPASGSVAGVGWRKLETGNGLI